MSNAHASVLRGEGIEPMVAGGKGAALDRLVALGAKVPATGIITTSAYRAFESIPAIASLVDELRGTEVPEPTEHERARKRVDEVFLSVPLPPDVADAVEAMAVEIADGGSMAVRSSATAEDLASASFAGQYESYLNVLAEGVHDAVRLVWSSLWYPAPRAYRRFRQISEADLTMAVVVMRMLDPTEAGVLFTVDPGGHDDAMRLEVVQGLGEKLVSGEATPDAHVVPRDVAEDRFAEISLPLRELAVEALRLEEAFGAAQDIEFAVHGGELYLLQARPITTLPDASLVDDGFDFSCGDETTYTTAGIAEMLPGVLAPLSWTVNSWLVENGFRHLFEVLGGGADVLTEQHALIGRFRARAALNLDAMRIAAASIPGGSAHELERQYFGEAMPSVSAAPEPEPPHLSKGASALQSVKVLRARRQAAEDSEVVYQAVGGVLDEEPALAGLLDSELLAYWNRLLHLSQRVVATEIVVAAMATAAYRGVEVFLCRYLDASEASLAAQRLTRKDASQRRSRIALSLDPVIASIATSPELDEAAVEEWQEAEPKLRAAPGGEALLREFHRLLRRAGSTGVFAGPTWDEVPHLAWMTVYQELRKPSSTDAATDRVDSRVEIEKLLTEQPRWRWSRFVSGQLVDVRRRFLRREAVDAAEFLQRRERTKACVLIIGGVVRRANLEIGRRLAARGVLETAEDVELLGVSEIPVLTGAAGPSPEIIATRRRRNLEARQAGPLPSVWTGVPEESEMVSSDGERFEGWSASPGRFEGLARIVDSPATSLLRRGEILIATTTDASWAPLFMAAGAIVVEQGGPLSHAAIVARELGMPAVVNVPGFIARLSKEDGPVPVAVDGTQGTVTILTASDTSGSDADSHREVESLARQP